jgi:hypothetical protein
LVSVYYITFSIFNTYQFSTKEHFRISFKIDFRHWTSHDNYLFSAVTILLQKIKCLRLRMIQHWASELYCLKSVLTFIRMLTLFCIAYIKDSGVFLFNKHLICFMTWISIYFWKGDFPFFIFFFDRCQSGNCWLFTLHSSQRIIFSSSLIWDGVA